MSLRFAVIGSPVAHSRSPEMHQAAFRALGVDATYERIRVEPDALAGFVARLAEDGYRGINVTLPHKAKVMALVDRSTPTARAIGAVNTVTVERSGLEGENTDAPGLVRALQAGGFDAPGQRIVVLGAGGAARAAVVGLAEAGASRIRIAARRPDAARALVDDLASHLPAALDALGLDDELEGAFAETDLLVQATSATLGETDEAKRFADALPMSALPRGAFVTDLVYAPRRTAVLRAAEAAGHATIDGLGMLVHQGALALERWLGQPAPVDAMRHVLSRA